jgi:hypothetical protein
LGNNIAQEKQQKATLENTIANTNYTGILASQAVAQPTTGLPVVPDDVFGGMSIPQVTSSMLPPLAVSKQGTVVGEAKAVMGTRIMPDGTTRTLPLGEDFDEMALNALIGGYHQMATGFGQLSTKFFGDTPTNALNKLGNAKVFQNFNKKFGVQLK